MIKPSSTLNSKFCLIPQDKLKKYLKEIARIKSPYVFITVYYQTMDKYKNAKVEDFATELAKVMANFELKNQQLLNLKSSLDDKFSRLSSVLTLYTEAKACGMLAKTNRASLRVTNLRTHEPGIYSADIRFGGEDKVLATNLKVDEADVEYAVLNKPPFDCEIVERHETFSVSLYNEAEELISEGSSWIFKGFSRVEPFPLTDNLKCGAATV
eukprot:TRINITY_DN6427_c0_g2_i4.p1 TRINITY_DN6427_c0_g2~~TRINITY_DN6427_c0_g2_i4.p1  ORF type:complete len:212 (-),score=48.95 TRINITY_DN6427_c0_g2_i4:1414-2049(-)